jgi:hypothetical protein
MCRINVAEARVFAAFRFPRTFDPGVCSEALLWDRLLTNVRRAISLAASAALGLGQLAANLFQRKSGGRPKTLFGRG